jgi:O-antigen/teichoic acid export membrane protein
MAQLIQWAGQLSVGVWGATSDVANFAVAQRTGMLITFVLTAVNIVMAPKFAALYEDGNIEDLREVSLNATKLTVIGALPIVIVMILFPNFIISLFGGGFKDAGLYLQILAVGQFVNAITGSVGYLLSMSGNERDLRNSSLISGVSVLSLCLIFVPMYGALGAAFSTAFGVICQNLLASHFVNKRLGFSPFKIWK